jgi:hypothetical protein
VSLKERKIKRAPRKLYDDVGGGFHRHLWLTTWSKVAAQASRRVRKWGRLKSFFKVAGTDECS